MSTPAGWYPDPSDPSNLRWWDGGRWTEHVHARAVQESPAGPSLSKAPDPYQNQYQGQNPYQQNYPQYPPSQYPAPGVKAIATPDGQALAGLGFRLLARIIDGLVVTLVAAAAGWSSLQTMTTLYTEALDAMVAGNSQAVFDLVENGTFSQASSNLTFITMAVSAVYTILTVKFYGATPGKAICRIRVRDWQRPGHPTWGQAIIRWVGSDLLGQMLILWYLIDFLWPCWDQRRQALHDKLARTVVVRK
jgi:uncharacterized RDD family membrane protein YckC